MSSIRIIEIPPGFAPAHIRMQWLGVVLPLATEEELIEHPLSGFSIGHGNENGYLVLCCKAAAVLRTAGKMEAANYWESFFSSYLEFKKETCEMVV